MNKGELIERLSRRLGDQKTSSAAVDAVVSEIESAVSSGEKVNITGFGVFEKRERAARTGRNPRTGEPIRVKKTTVPAFRPGASFKGLVSGGGTSGQAGGRGTRSHAAKAQSSYAKGQSSYAKAPSSYAKSSAYDQSMRGQSQRAQTRRAQAPRAQQNRAQGAQAARASSRRAPSASANVRTSSSSARAKHSTMK